MRQSPKRRSECFYDWALDTPKMTPSFHLAHVSIPLILQFAEISDHHYSSPDTAFQCDCPIRVSQGSLCSVTFVLDLMFPHMTGRACWWPGE